LPFNHDFGKDPLKSTNFLVEERKITRWRAHSSNWLSSNGPWALIDN
jgi:hypothetical protein